MILLLFSDDWYSMACSLFGGYSCLGKALCLALGEKGVFVTVVDFSEEKGQEVASIIQQKNAKLHPKLEVPPAIFVRCDVTNTSEWNLLSYKFYWILSCLKNSGGFSSLLHVSLVTVS